MLMESQPLAHLSNNPDAHQSHRRLRQSPFTHMDVSDQNFGGGWRFDYSRRYTVVIHITHTPDKPYVPKIPCFLAEPTFHFPLKVPFKRIRRSIP
jgi:hypothetical protein